jgi:ubiquinone/menaquinone biosynthesis C-methylase UbiE
MGSNKSEATNDLNKSEKNRKMKDNFSKQANIYAKFRPDYPSKLYDFILQNTANRNTAWDCATGNGQAAKILAQNFDTVYATDISQKQLDNAVKADNIFYAISPAEKTLFEDHTFDLVTVAQAVHWFNFDAFYQEVKRVAKPDATLAIWGYGTLRFDIDKEIDRKMWDFYANTVGSYWDFERSYIDAEYKTLPFPFKEIASPQYNMGFLWQRDEFEGFLNSWSAVQNFIKKQGYNPVPAFIFDISPYWGELERKNVRFPLFLKLGKVNDC